MKKILIIAILAICFLKINAQVNLSIQEYDSIKNEQKLLVEINMHLQDSIKNLVINSLHDSNKANDSIATLHKSYKKELKKQITENKKISKELSVANRKVDDLLKNKILVERDSLLILLAKTKSENLKFTALINEKENDIAISKQQCEQKILQEYENGKQQALSTLEETYKNKAFDDLIKATGKESVQRDKSLVGNNDELKLVLNDLLIYFNAKEQLSKRFDAVQIKNKQAQLDQIKQNSILVDKLKKDFAYYKIFNNGLIEMLNKIIKIDKEFIVDGMNEETIQLKQNLIFSEISYYIFNYDFNLSDYPYISNIVIEIFKRKQPNADADISDLLMRL